MKTGIQWYFLDKQMKFLRKFKKNKKILKKVLTNESYGDIIFFVDAVSVMKIKYASMLELADRHV